MCTSVLSLLSSYCFYWQNKPVFCKLCLATKRASWILGKLSVVNLTPSDPFRIFRVWCQKRLLHLRFVLYLRKSAGLGCCKSNWLSNSGTWQKPLIFLGLCFPALLSSSQFVNCYKFGCWLQRRTTWKWVCVFRISGWHNVKQKDAIVVTHCSIIEDWEHVTQDKWESQQYLCVSRILCYDCLLLSVLQLKVS